MATDYYPFGMGIHGRKLSIGDYRFGFNGMEKDDELYGNGNIYTAQFWKYDSRLGRRWNIDPIQFTGLSPYATFAGNPVKFDDPNGDCPICPFLAKGAASAATDFLIQTIIIYATDDNVPSGWDGFTTAMTKVDKADIGWSFLTGALNPFSNPAGRHSEAVVTAMADVAFNAGKALRNGEDYSMEEAGRDFLIGLLAQEASIGVDELLKSKKVQQLLKTKPCGCFTAETVVKTEEGYKAISEIMVGDLVWAYNDTTGETGLKRVAQTFVLEWGEIYKIYVGDEVIEATHENWMFMWERWVKVDELGKGDTLTLYDGAIASIDSISVVSGSQRVYNFEVEEYHTYFVSEVDILVHNGIPCFVEYRRKFTTDRPESLGDEIFATFQTEYGPLDIKTMFFKLEDGVAKIHVDRIAPSGRGIDDHSMKGKLGRDIIPILEEVAREYHRLGG
ncbi:MAG: polymorphic toxin-type HINT domain-containing protein, partial [Bacteroidota bacterium]